VRSVRSGPRGRRHDVTRAGRAYVGCLCLGEDGAGTEDQDVAELARGRRQHLDGSRAGQGHFDQPHARLGQHSQAVEQTGRVGPAHDGEQPFLGEHRPQLVGGHGCLRRAVQRTVQLTVPPAGIFAA
jgi:hypothetical protein